MKKAFILLAMTLTYLPGYVRAQNPVVVDVAPMYEKNARYKALRERFYKETAPYQSQRNELKSTIAYWQGLLRSGKLNAQQYDSARAEVIEASRRLEDLDLIFRRDTLTPFAREMDEIHEEIIMALDDMAAKKRWHAVVPTNSPSLPRVDFE